MQGKLAYLEAASRAERLQPLISDQGLPLTSKRAKLSHNIASPFLFFWSQMQVLRGEIPRDDELMIQEFQEQKNTVSPKIRIPSSTGGAWSLA
jgi:hypothetical protein